MIKKILKIHYLSDIHLEFYDLTKIPRLLKQIIPQSNICVLAGDIGYPFQKSYEAFLRGIHLKFEHIFLIHGNHEYYQLKDNKGKTNQEIVDKTRKILEEHQLNNIHFLRNSHYDIDDYRFVGSILWSKIEDPRYLSNDYEMIYQNSIDEMNCTHENDRKYIQNTLIQAKTDQKKVIMITHHLPSFELNHPKYARHYKYHQCFSSHSDDLICDPVKLWIFGHTHMQIKHKINDIICTANPIGYPGENMNISFNKVIFVEEDEEEESKNE